MKIILCITGSIAATEDLKLIHELQRHDFDVEVFMTDDACELVTPLSMEFASKHPVTTHITAKVEHVVNAKADLILVAPSTANTISKFANRIADTSVTTLLLTASGYNTPILFVPSMHISMYYAIEDNINKIKRNYSQAYFMEPIDAENKAKFPSKEDIVLEVERIVSSKKLKNKRVLITTGATFEKIDSMRGITNRSTGKMGVEVAKEAYRQGADVTLICGSIHTHVPKTIRRINVESTNDIIDTIKDIISDFDIYISVAAISDFKVVSDDTTKISSDSDAYIKLESIPKVLPLIKELNSDIMVVGFKAEAGLSDDQLVSSARSTMKDANADLMVANDLLQEDGGVGSDNNEVILVTSDTSDKIPHDSKSNIAKTIINRIASLL
ncbi:MAG: bifunctional phosphopantothenoylcysteine decarboxylase/phosphopantothenate--cysteine ligase CoaBC [Methanosphaera sp.]|nr:bifunctional phosphopantothenoylcysteine decarboxylase/phosphopantothenate--cysteine ligase CoaBC [Methanosphaera sp.]